MALKKVSVIIFVGLIMLWLPSARAVTLESADQGFSVSLPGNWSDSEPPDEGVVLLTKNGRAEIKIRALSGTLSDKALKAKLQASRKKLQRSGITVPNKIFSAAPDGDGRFYSIQFTSKGKKYRSGYFSLAGRSYSVLASGLSEAEFQALAATLTPLTKAGKAESAAGQLPIAAVASPPAASPNGAPANPQGALGAPPADTAFGNGGAPAAADNLPELPRRKVGSSLGLFLLLLAISAAALGYRSFASKDACTANEPTAAGSLYPFHVERRYLSFPITFDIQNAAGQHYRAVSHRVPSLLLGTGLCGYFLMKVLVQAIVFSGVDPQTIPAAVQRPILSLISLTNILILSGLALMMFFRKKLKIYDSSGGLVLNICQKRVSFLSLFFFIRDSAGTELGTLKRVGLVLFRRRWQLLDTEGRVLLEMCEDSFARAIARKLLGHLWGLLRTNYIISDATSAVGSLRREWSIWNRFDLSLVQAGNLDPRLVLATALFLDVVDPDRWHPWHN
ncbi:MAG: hypothetical protein WCK75_04750 [Elusimicrobiota bacterium]